MYIYPYLFNADHIDNQADIRGWDVPTTITDFVNRCVVLEMQEDEEFKNRWILKGGSCMNICYLEDHCRASADLGFTIYQNDICKKSAKEKLKKVFREIEQKTCEKIKFGEINISKRSSKKYLKFSSEYSLVEFPDAKYAFEIEGSKKEKLIDPPPESIFAGEEMILPWSSINGPRIKCYKIEEAFAEMLRALVERNIAYNNGTETRILKIARNIYDIVMFRKCYGGYLDPGKLKVVIKQKFEHKEGLRFPEDLRKMTLPEIPLNIWEELIRQTIYKACDLKEMDLWKREDSKTEYAEKDMSDHLKEIKCIVDCVLDLYNRRNIQRFNYLNYMYNDSSYIYNEAEAI